MYFRYLVKPHVFASGQKTVLVKLTFFRTCNYVANFLFSLNHNQLRY